MLYKLPACSITRWCTAKSMNQLFYNIASGNIHKKIRARKKKIWRFDLLTLSACSIGLWSTLTILNLIAWLCQLCYIKSLCKNCFKARRRLQHSFLFLHSTCSEPIPTIPYYVSFLSVERGETNFRLSILTALNLTLERTELAPVVQSVDNTIHLINHYPVDKCWQNKLRHPLDRDLSGG